MSNDSYITDAMVSRKRAAFVILAISLLLTIFGALTSPDEVPIHWGFSGTPDAYGTPWVWLIMWCVLAGATGLCALLAKHLPVENWNKPYSMDGEMLEAWYSFSMAIMFDTMLMISVLELAFAVIIATKIFTATPILILVLVALILAYTIYSITKWRNLKRKL